MSNSPTPGHASGKSHQHDGHPLVGHLVPLWILFLTGSALVVLTIITVAAHSVDLGEFNIVFALVIAAIKATLVGLFFMHLRWDRPFNQLVFVGSIVFVLLLMIFCMMDSKQYQSQLVGGNPSMAQMTIDKEAPNAPIAKQAPVLR